MTTWGLIGSGHIGTTVARLAVAAGHDVVVSNRRGPQTLAELDGESTTSSQGWRTQSDAAAYSVMYAVNPQSWDQGARPASAVEVAQRAVASRRRHDPPATRPTAPIRIET
jgi:predicted dinucleotide-binding enzyme